MINMNVSTSAHKLTLKSYADCLMTSGAIQKGVPTNVFLLIWVSVSCPATPKSASFTSPCSDNSTLAAGWKTENNFKTQEQVTQVLSLSKQAHSHV